MPQLPARLLTNSLRHRSTWLHRTALLLPPNLNTRLLDSPPAKELSVLIGGILTTCWNSCYQQRMWLVSLFALQPLLYVCWLERGCFFPRVWTVRPDCWDPPLLNNERGESATDMQIQHFEIMKSRFLDTFALKKTVKYFYIQIIVTSAKEHVLGLLAGWCENHHDCHRSCLRGVPCIK